MMFDVGVRLAYNANGKAQNRFFRVRDIALSGFVRATQENGQFVFSIIPLIPLHKLYPSRFEKDLMDTEVVDDENKFENLGHEVPERF